MIIPSYQNQGQEIAPGWNAQSLLRNWTALFGTDNERFAPPNDRSGYTDGVERRMNTGGVLMAGFPVNRLTFPWLSDGQLKYLYVTINGGAESGNVTTRNHTSLSVGRLDVSTFNAVMNLNMEQTTTLTRLRNGYLDYVVEFVLVEAL